jgi:predicted SAM-dependent methyltransferase
LISTQVIHHALLVEVRRAIREIWDVLSEGGIAFVTVPGQKDKDVAYREIEPGTFIPLDGPERGLAHHFFSEEELRQEFALFKIEEIGLRDRGKVIAMWVKKLAGGT